MEGNQVKKIFSQIGLSVAIFLVIQQVMIAIISGLVATFAPEISEAGWYMWALSYGPLYLIAFPVFLLMFNRIPNGSGGPKEYKKLSLIHMLEILIISFGIVYLLQIFTTLISTWVAQIRGSGLTNPLAEVVTSSNPWVTILFVAIIAPVMEEIIFRRLMYNKLIPFGGKIYVLFSAFIFALFHANVYQLIYAFLLGVIFAGITYYTGTIRYTIILHVIINFIGSGVGSLLLAYSNKTVLAVWGTVIIILMAAGLIMGIVWWVRHRKDIHFEPGTVAISDKKIIFLNGGMLFYMILILAIIVVTLMM